MFFTGLRIVLDVCLGLSHDGSIGLAALTL